MCKNITKYHQGNFFHNRSALLSNTHSSLKYFGNLQHSILCLYLSTLSPNTHPKTLPQPTPNRWSNLGHVPSKRDTTVQTLKLKQFIWESKILRFLSHTLLKLNSWQYVEGNPEGKCQDSNFRKRLISIPSNTPSSPRPSVYIPRTGRVHQCAPSIDFPHLELDKILNATWNDGIDLNQ